MARRRRGGGGIIGLISSASLLFVLIGFIVAWARTNNIHDFNSLLNYTRSWTNTVSDGTFKDELRSRFKKVGGSVTIPSVPSLSQPIELPDIKGKVDSVRVQPSVSHEYSRSEWKHWTGTPCNTRQEILKQQGENVTVGDKCRITGGKWIDPYSLEEFTNQKNLDIDHVIPLKWANDNGGSSWSPEMKEQFANDPVHLLAVSAKENRKKGASGPSEYMPPNKKFTCAYSRIWIETLTKYGLTAPEKDMKVLRDGIETCK